MHGSEAQLAFALEIAGGVGTWDWDLKADLIYADARFASLFGVDPEIAATVGAPSAQYISAIHPDDQHIVIEATQKAIETIGPYIVEFRLPRKDGADMWVYALGHAYADDDGVPSRFPGAAMDITQRKNMETELKVARDRAERILGTITDGFFTLDRSFCFSYVNSAAEQLLAAQGKDLVGKNIWLMYPDAAGTELRGLYERVAQEKVALEFEWNFEAWARWFAVKAYPADAGGVVVYFRDITDHKRAEKQDREHQEYLRESARLESLGVMAGGIAHDFNNLLTGIMGNASLLAADASGGDAEIVSEILLAAQRAADLTKQMLAFSGNAHFTVEPFDLSALVNENLVLMRSSFLRTASLEVRLSKEPCSIEADRAQIQQVVMNILLNASEASGDRPGKIYVRTEVVDRKESYFSDLLRRRISAGRYTLFEVRDAGVGMSSETLRRIFDPFFTTKFTGRGLGLAAVLGIVKGHRGDIEVVTKPGHGAAFRVYIPASETERLVQPKLEEAVVLGRYKGAVVLLVDDEDVVREFGARALRTKGLRVVTATNGEEAVDQLRVNPEISLVLLDLTMPVMSGEQAIPLIRQIRPTVPIILSSGYTEDELTLRLSNVGVPYFLYKPYTYSSLLKKIIETLDASA